VSPVPELAKDFAFGLLASALIAVPAWRKRSLSGSGLAAAIPFGAAVWAGAGWKGFVVLGAFFFSSSILSKLFPAPASVEAVVEKGGRRDHVQVLANGGTALAFAVLYRFEPRELWYLGFACALAAATADTWASEIGPRSKAPPRMILSGRTVEAGLSGGVSPLGFAASLAGAAFIAGAAVGLLALPELARGQLRIARILQALLVTGAGFAGSVIDSILGELFQARYRRGDGSATERRAEAGVANRLEKGAAWFDNNLVNFLSTLAASQIAWLALLMR